MQIVVKEKPKPVERVIAKTEEPVQKIVSEQKIVRESRMNRLYKKSQVSVQGLLWTIQSTDIVAANQDSPVSTGLGVHTYLWKGRHGFEGSLKSGVFGVNETGQESASLKSIEPRYHYRFLTRLPFSFMREIMYSVFAGYELYRNSADNISNEYDLLKFGTSIVFPIRNYWTSGGEFVYGKGTDSSNKLEISGHVNYFLKPEWSLGFGYRLHLFQAGSTASSASGLLPYREGYTEGFSVLNYHF